MIIPQWLTKEEALARITIHDKSAVFCPECLTRLVLAEWEKEDKYWYCPNELCLREDTYDMSGAINWERR